MFGDSHKNHSFEHLKDVYDRHQKVIRDESTGLRTRLAELNEGVREVQTTIEKVRNAKDERQKELESVVENIRAKLDSESKDKIIKLIDQKKALVTEIEQLEDF
jgi:prefoldin subunit 5